MFAGIILILNFFQYESPRYLIKKGRDEQATKTMAIIRNLPQDDSYVVREINSIQVQLQEEEEATMGQGWMGVIKEMFLIPSNFYRLYLGLMSQFLSQWSGAGSITLYAVNFFALLRITGTNEALLATAVFGIVKLVAVVVCALFLVDVIGRRRSLLIGITLQAISMIYIAGFLTAVPKLGAVTNFVLPEFQKGAGTGAIVMIYISGIGWALGWNSMQYLLNAELFPLRIRAVSTSVIMCFHFANQYGNTRAVPNMLLPKATGGINPSGTFWFFAVVTIVGGTWVWFTIPETAGRDLESMDRLFNLPWYKIGIYGNEAAEKEDANLMEKEAAMGIEHGIVRQVSVVETGENTKV